MRLRRLSTSFALSFSSAPLREILKTLSVQVKLW